MKNNNVINCRIFQNSEYENVRNFFLLDWNTSTDIKYD